MIDITNLDDFSSLIEIPLDAEPNYTFDIFLAEQLFTIQIRTFVDNQTRISILSNNVVLADNAPISIYQKNLLFYSDFDLGAIFFLRNNAMTDEPTFLNFKENDLRLFYGNF